MDIAPIETANMLTAVTEKHSIIALLLLVVLVLCLVVRVLYQRNVAQCERLANSLVESTVAMNNNTKAMDALARQIERINDAR